MSLRRRHINYSGSPLPVLTYLGSGSSTSGGDLTFSFGTPSPKRYLIALVGCGDGALTVTIGGVAATELVRQLWSGTSAGATGIYIALVPTGTSGIVTITNSNSNRAAALYSATGLASASAFDTASATTKVTLKPLPMDIDVQANGFILACDYSGQNGAGLAEWTGLTPDANFNFSELSFTGLFSCGNIQSPTADTKNITVSGNGTNTCCAVSLR